ncbi:MAG: lipoyl(octanoyl) transferase LipB [Odoribacteraceae bacterium]|jgi:lipoyl(octanoyl) transferase|nr:lipoyl(octanoyl) transferase LipB [Odoribacteraceae bacterium]
MTGQLEWVDLGVMDYLAAWERQRLEAREAEERRATGKTIHRVLLVEHPHVYTLGKNGDEANLLAPEGVTLLRVNRGGDITYHGPGQLVVYPVIDLLRAGAGVRQHVDWLEEIVIRVLLRHGITGERLPGATGVWIEPRGNAPRKICAIGIHCSRGITTHGFALNVNTDLDRFKRLNPCGIVDKGVTSIARELGRPVDMENVKAAVREETNTLWNKTRQP